MFKRAGVLILLTIAVSVLVAQTPNWDDTIMTELTDTQVNKSINHGCIFIDENDQIHVVYLENRREDNDDEKLLFYTVRDSMNVWSRPDIINDAGLYFNRPNVIKNPVTGELEVFGDIEGVLHRITKEDNEWRGREIELDFPVYGVNTAIDQDGYVHIVGVIQSEDRANQIVYLTDFEGELSYSIIRESVPVDRLDNVRAVIDLSDDGIAVIGYVGRRDLSQAYIAQNNEQGGHEWSHQVTQIPEQTAQVFNLLVRNNIIHLISSGMMYWPGTNRLFYQYRSLEQDRWSETVLTNEGNSSVMPSMAFDGRDRLHILAKEVMMNIFTGNIKYITNSNPEEEWEVSRPFDEDYDWEWPQLVIDSQDNFQMLVIKKTEADKEIVHIGVPLETPLPTPQNLIAESHENKITLKWDEPDLSSPILPELSGYDIQRRFDDEQEFEVINTEIIEETYYIDEELHPGQYSYYVTAIFEDESSEASNIVNVILKDHLPMPEFKPEPKKYLEPVKVEIICPIDKGVIYYTTDGSLPDSSAKNYNEPIILFEDTKIKAVSYHHEYLTSEVAAAFYVIKDLSAQDGSIPEATKFLPVHPNPFNPYTNLSYSLAEQTPVKLEVFNIRGEKIDLLVDEVQAPGDYSIVWRGLDSSNRSMPSGVYYFRLITDNLIRYRRAVMIK